MDNRVPQDLQNRFAGLERLAWTTNHNRQRAVAGAHIAATDGGIEHAHLLCLQTCGQARRVFRIIGRHVDHHAAWRRTLQHTLLPQQHEFNVWGIREHRNHHLSLLSHLS